MDVDRHPKSTANGTSPGRLSHRLIEELYRVGAFRGDAELESECGRTLERLIHEEGAILLRPGMSFELFQLKRQLTTAAKELREILIGSQLNIVEIEGKATVPWKGGELTGRLDVLLRDTRGTEIVLDLKWGQSKYKSLLTKGLAIQLAVYAAVRQRKTDATEFPVAAYYAVSRSKLLTTDASAFSVRPLVGPRLEETWTKLERTVQLIETTLAAGRIPVTGASPPTRLLELLKVPEPEREHYLDHDEASHCEHCEYGALCGRSWSEYG